jgi:4-hydroxybenzoate polyprenyltransferase
MPSSTRIADAPEANWVDRFLPGGLKPCLRLSRLDRPIGWWLLLIPCWWSLTLAQIAAGGGLPNLRYALLFFLGAVVMRGAGCTLNDIVDRDLDSRVERTRARPIPAGEVSVTAATAYLIAQALIGLLILVQFNRTSIVIGAASLAAVAVYPFMKRFTYWPQIFLGLAFSWGALMGWAGERAALELPAFLLYAGSIAWVIHYDTIYAHQDREDDALIGIKSTARLFAENTRPALLVFYGIAVVLIGVALKLSGCGWPAFVGLAAFAVHLAWQIKRLEISDPALCLKLFKSNRDAGLLLFAGLVIDAVLRAA